MSTNLAPGALTHPDLEELAAFLDGMLPEKDRARVVEHLADCEECYEIFAGAARFQEDQKQDSVVPFVPKRRSPIRQWLPLAAAALLAVAVGVPLYRAYMAPPDMAVTTLTAAYSEKTEEAASSLWFEPGMRGADEPSFAERAASFMLGVYVFNLQIGLEANDRERLEGHIFPKINALLNSEAVVMAADIAKKSEQIRHEIRDGRPSREFLDEAAALDADLEERVYEASYLDLGKWTAAARLAAVTKNPEFFDRRDNQRFPAWFLRKERESLTEPEVAGALDKVQEILAEDPIDYDALRQQLDTILTAYDN